MSRRIDWQRYAPWILGALLVFVTQLPWLWAWIITPEDRVFTGYVGGGLDYWTYLSKMRQGWEGSWTWHNLYDATGTGSWFLFPFYLALGRLTRLLGFDYTALPVTFHLAATVLMSLTLAVVWRLICRVQPDHRLRLWTLAIAVWASSGALLFQNLAHARDLEALKALSYYDAYPGPHLYMAGFCFPHYLLDIMGVTGSMLLLLEQLEAPRWWRPLAAAGLMAMVSLVHPHIAALGLLVMGLHGLTLSVGRWQAIGFTAAAALGVVPYSIYLARVLFVGELASWRGQALAFTPPIHLALIGIGLVLPLAFWAAPRAFREGGADRMAALWLTVAFLLSNVRLPLVAGGGELLIGLSVPAAILFVRWLGNRHRLVQTFLGQLSVLGAQLTLVAAVAAAFLQVKPGAPSQLYIPEATVRELAGLQQRHGPGAYVAPPALATKLPWLAGVRVVWGHTSETPASQETLKRERAFCEGTADTAAREAFVKEFGVVAVLDADPAVWPAVPYFDQNFRCSALVSINDKRPG